MRFFLYYYFLFFSKRFSPVKNDDTGTPSDRAVTPRSYDKQKKKKKNRNIINKLFNNLQLFGPADVGI